MAGEVAPSSANSDAYFNNSYVVSLFFDIFKQVTRQLNNPLGKNSYFFLHCSIKITTFMNLSLNSWF